MMKQKGDGEAKDGAIWFGERPECEGWSIRRTSRDAGHRAVGRWGHGRLNVG